MVGERVAPDVLAAMLDTPEAEIRGCSPRRSRRRAARCRRLRSRPVRARAGPRRGVRRDRRPCAGPAPRSGARRWSGLAHTTPPARSPTTGSGPHGAVRRPRMRTLGAARRRRRPRGARLRRRGRLRRAGGAAARAVRRDDTDVRRLVIRLAEAQFLANRVPQSIADLRAAASWRRRPGGGICWRGPRSSSTAWGSIRHSGGPAPVRAGAWCCWTPTTMRPGPGCRPRSPSGWPRPRVDRGAAELSAEALAEAERSGDPDAILDAISARHLAISVPQTVRERLDLGRRAVELGAVRASRSRRCGAMCGGGCRVPARQPRRGERELGEVEQVARERGSVLARWHYLRYRAVRESSPPTSTSPGPPTSRPASWPCASAISRCWGWTTPSSWNCAGCGVRRRSPAGLLRGDQERATDAAGADFLPDGPRAGRRPGKGAGGVRGIPASAGHLPGRHPLGRNGRPDRQGSGAARRRAKCASGRYEQFVPFVHEYAGDGSGGSSATARGRACSASSRCIAGA